MATYGYARVSHVSPSLDVQIKALKAAGCSVIRAEKKSGTSLQDRTELKTLLDFVRQGDILAVTRIDRIARSTADLFDILRILEAKGVSLKATEQPIDTSTALGRSLIGILGIFSELETISAASARWNPSVASRRSTGRSPSTNAPTKVARRRSSRMRCGVSRMRRSSGLLRSRPRSGSGGRACIGS